MINLNLNLFRKSVSCVFFYFCLLSGLSHAQEWESPFNGKNFDGWSERTKLGAFHIEDDCIVGTATDTLGTTFLCYDKIYQNFVLKFECMVEDEGLNSGVQIRSLSKKARGKAKHGNMFGPQVEISPKSNGNRSGLIFGQSWGEWLTPKEELKNSKIVKPKQWFHFKVLADRDKITTWINETKITTTMVRAERHATNFQGHFALQVHAIKPGKGPYRVKWRNIRIKALPDTPKEDIKKQEVPEKEPEFPAQPSTPKKEVGDKKMEKKKLSSKTLKKPRRLNQVEKSIPNYKPGQVIMLRGDGGAGVITLKHEGPKRPFPVPPKFKDHQLTIFAITPEVNCPVALVTEPSGAVLVMCDDNAALATDPNKGSIRRLIDHDNDGVADTMTYYVKNLDTPRGGVFLDGSLYLCHPPYISRFTDLNDDGVADEQVILAKGFGHDLHYKRGGDHTTNGLKIGLDGWIYVACGDYGAKATGVDGSEVSLLGGGIVRMRTDGSDLEIYARGTRNTFDIAISPKLDIVTLDNTNDGDGWDMRLHHLTPLCHLGYPNLFKNFTEDAVPSLYDFGGGSGAGCLFIDEPYFPSWMNKRFHTISWGKLFTHDLSPHEATFVVDKNKVTYNIPKLLDFDIDGMSKLYFACFDGGGARTKPGTPVGRIFRLLPKDRKESTFPDLGKATLAELMNYMTYPSNVMRLSAQQEILYRESDEILPSLGKLITNPKANIEARIAALFTYTLKAGEAAQKYLVAWSSDASLTEFCIRALADQKNFKDVTKEQLKSLCAHWLTLDDPRVRLQTIYAISKFRLNSLSPELVKLVDDHARRKPLVKDVSHKHEVIPHTAKRALIEMQPVTELHALLAENPSDQTPLLVLNQIHTEENIEKLEALSKAQNFAFDIKMVETLIRLYHTEAEWDGHTWWTTKPNSNGPYYQGVTWSQSDKIKNVLSNIVKNSSEKEQTDILTSIRKHNIAIDSLNIGLKIDPLDQLLDQESHTAAQLADLIKIVNDNKFPNERRVKAYRLALDVTGADYRQCSKLWLSVFDNIPAKEELYGELKAEYLSAAIHRKQSRFLAFALDSYRRYSPATRKIISELVCSSLQSPLLSAKGKQVLLRGLNNKKAPDEFIIIVVEKNMQILKPYLTNLIKKGGKQAQLANEALAKLKANESKSSVKLVKDVTEKELRAHVMKNTGDTAVGKKFFTSQACSACHALSSTEVQKGPYLGTIGGLFTRDQLITHIIKPNAEVAQGFQTVQLKLKKGMKTGFITQRDENKIQLRNIAGISEQILVTDVVEEKVLKQSQMPAGLVDNISLEAFTSLIEFLVNQH